MAACGWGEGDSVAVLGIGRGQSSTVSGGISVGHVDWMTTEGEAPASRVRG